jgi:hypothetical protein
MIDYGARELAASFRTVRGNTIQIAREIPEDRYGFQPAPDMRTVGRLLVHIAVAPVLQRHIHEHRATDLTQVNFTDLLRRAVSEEAKPRGKAEIVALLERMPGIVPHLTRQMEQRMSQRQAQP